MYKRQSLSFMNGLGQIYSSMGQVHCLRGQYKEAMALLEKAVECLERNGYRWGLEMCIRDSSPFLTISLNFKAMSRLPRASW